MFSLQKKLLGEEDKFFNLLEASAEEARTSVQAHWHIFWYVVSEGWGLLARFS